MLLGVDAKWGAAGITASAGLAGWVEFLMLRRGLCRRLGRFDLPTSELLKLWAAAIVAGVVSASVQLVAPPSTPPIPLLLATVPLNMVVYLGLTMWWDIPEAAVLTGRIGRVLRR